MVSVDPTEDLAFEGCCMQIETYSRSLNNHQLGLALPLNERTRFYCVMKFNWISPLKTKIALTWLNGCRKCIDDTKKPFSMKPGISWPKWEYGDGGGRCLQHFIHPTHFRILTSEPNRALPSTASTIVHHSSHFTNNILHSCTPFVSLLVCVYILIAIITDIVYTLFHWKQYFNRIKCASMFPRFYRKRKREQLPATTTTASTPSCF